MNSILDDVKKLPVEERANLFLALKSDNEINEYLDSAKPDRLLFEEIARRDAAYNDGKIHLTTMDELSDRLKSRRNAL